MKKLFLNALFVLAGFALILVLFLVIRQGQANREVEVEWQAALPLAPILAETSKLEIIPLYEEAQKNDAYVSGHGVSYLVRTDAATVLLDVGNNPDGLSTAPTVQNMRSLGISPEAIDAILISHPHPDHIGGTDAWRRKTISFGEMDSGFGEIPVFTPVEMTSVGSIHSTGPALVGIDVATTGVISYPEIFPLSLFAPKGSEQALVVNVAGEGLVLITGCGHPTIEKLVTRAEALYGLPVVGVVGGLHYEGVAVEVVEAAIAFLQPREPRLVALSPHDCGPEEIEAFRSAFPEAHQVIQIGERIHLP